MSYVIRTLEINELPLLCGLFDYNDEDDMILQNTEKIRGRECEIFGLFSDNELIGELHAKYKSDDVREAVPNKRTYLYGFRIRGNMQNRGLGKMLLQNVLATLSKRGYSEFTIGVENDNNRAKHIYDSFGFTEIIARKYEVYQGDGYEYNLYLMRCVVDKVWTEMYKAAKSVQNGRKISDYIEAGGVAAAVLSSSGKIYTGVCIDTCSTLGICAERNAIFNMITNGEQEISKVLAIMPDGKTGAPCGACRELMVQLMPDSNKDIEIMLDYEKEKIVTLGELTPEWWI